MASLIEAVASIALNLRFAVAASCFSNIASTIALLVKDSQVFGLLFPSGL